MPKHIWINPTGLGTDFGQIAWSGNIPKNGKILGYYLLPYSKNFNTTADISSFKNVRATKMLVTFNDAFGAVWYSKVIEFIGSPTSAGNVILFYGGDLFQFPLEIEESLLSVAFTQVFPDWLDNYAVSTNTIDGTPIGLGSALLVGI